MTRIEWMLAHGLVAVFLFAACSSVDRPRAFTLGVEPLRGELEVGSVTIPPGTALGFDSDLVIDSEGDIVIAGALNGLARPPSESFANHQGADLTLRSATQIVITGSVIGAPGRDGRVNAETLKLLGLDADDAALDPQRISEQLQAYIAEHGADGVDLAIFDGGRGGNVYLIAPKIYVNLVKAGCAGSGGPGGCGGDGGTVRTTPSCVASNEGAPGIFGGDAGNAGPAMWQIRDGQGGRGGAGGGALGGSLAFDG